MWLPWGSTVFFSFFASACSVFWPCATLLLAHSPFPGHQDTFFCSSFKSGSFLPLGHYICCFFCPEGSFLKPSSGWFFLTVQTSSEKSFLDLWILSLCPNHSQWHLTQAEIICFLASHILTVFIMLRIRVETLSVLFTWFLHTWSGIQ